MANFHYKARSARGELYEGTVEAPSADAVAAQLLAGDLSPVAIEEVSASVDLWTLLREKS